MTVEPDNQQASGKLTCRLATIILSPIFLIVSSVGGCYLGTGYARDIQLQDGGRNVIPAGMMVDVYYPVAVYNKATDAITLESAARERAPELFSKVGNNNDLSFLLPESEGQYDGSDKEEKTAHYRATSLDANTQRIELHWNVSDDAFGVTTYKATEDAITQERYGLVSPGLMANGMMAAIGLLMVLFTLGNHLDYLSKDERTGTASHYALCALLGGMGTLMILLVFV